MDRIGTHPQACKEPSLTGGSTGEARVAQVGWRVLSMLCSGANHIHTPCLSLGTLYAFQCRLHSWTEKGVGVASLLLSHFYAAVWLTLQPGRGIIAPPSSSKPCS